MIGVLTSAYAQTKPSVKPAISLEQLSKYKVMPNDDFDLYFDYTWIDDKTVLLLQGDFWDHGNILTFPQEKYPQLVHNLYEKFPTGIFGLESFANGSLIGFYEGHSYTLLSQGGKLVSDGRIYHSGISVSPDGKYLVSYFVGGNGNFYKYPTVNIKSIKVRGDGARITNNPRNHLFGYMHYWRFGFSKESINVLSNPTQFSSEDDHLQTHLILRKRNRSRLNGPTTTTSIRLAIRGRPSTTWFSLDGENFAVVVYTGQEPDYKSHLLVGNIHSKTTSILVSLPSTQELFGSTIRWKPNGKEISFVYNNVLYAVPIN